MSFSFRLRFVLPKRLALNIDDTVVRLSERGSAHVVELKSAEIDKVIKDARRLSVVGAGYATEEEALRAGERWRLATEIGFVQNNIGADFGDRSPKSFVYPEGIKMLEAQFGKRILNDTHGLMVYKTEPGAVVFSVGEVTVTVNVDKQRTVSAIKAAYGTDASKSPQWRLAYNLYAASFFEASPDARFLMLMMSIETMIVRKKRTEQIVRHVDMLILETQKSSLSREERNALIRSLNDLTYQSISQAGRELVRHLGDKEYDSVSATTFFNRCYSMRSRLVHGSHPRPSWNEVNHTTGPLERFVGDLLSSL